MRQVPYRDAIDEARELYYGGKLSPAEYLERVLTMHGDEQPWQALVRRVELSFVRLMK